MSEQPQRSAKLGKFEPPPQVSVPVRGGITPPPQAPALPLARPLRLIDQLLMKTKEGKLSWTTGFEDGQFKTVLQKGELAFVIQVKGDIHKFVVLDERQESVLEEAVTGNEAQFEHVQSPKYRLYDGIGKLQEQARNQALQVNEKLVKAEKLLDAI